MADEQAVIITVLIVENSKKEIPINNKIQRVYLFESFREILSDIYDGGKGCYNNRSARFELG